MPHGDGTAAAAVAVALLLQVGNVQPDAMAAAHTTLHAPVPFVELADLNADVRDSASSYRDPVIATPQDAVTGVRACVQISCWHVLMPTYYAAVPAVGARHEFGLDNWNMCRFITRRRRAPCLADSLSGSATPTLPDLGSAGEKLGSVADEAATKFGNATDEASTRLGNATDEASTKAKTMLETRTGGAQDATKSAVRAVERAASKLSS
jgi:uncharacterized protein YjbJ (UPF0337 family)